MHKHSHTSRVYGSLVILSVALLDIGAMVQTKADASAASAMVNASKAGVEAVRQPVVLGPAVNSNAAPAPKSVTAPVAPALKPMSADSILLYRKIFMYQAAGDIKTADAILHKLKDTRLRGAVLYQRFIHPSYRPSFAELRDWLNRYADQPGADRIYKLAQNRVPKNFKGTLKRPVDNGWTATLLPALSEQGKTYAPKQARNDNQVAAIQALKKSVRLNIRKGDAAAAEHTLSTDPTARMLDPAEYDQLRGETAKGFLDAGKMDAARRLAAASVKRSGSDAPDAAWVGGLAAWRQKDYKQAAKLFEQVAVSPYASSWLVSAGGYWASRAAFRAGDAAKIRPFLQLAAAHPRTFYGLLATRALGWDFDFDWTVPPYTTAHKAILTPIPAFERADALVSIGQFHLAEAELLTIDPDRNADLQQALMAYAGHAGLASLAMRLAESYARPDGRLYDAALYPLSPWKPSGGYRVDEALVDALIRQESRFDPDAQSYRGAAGLMQLMPATASFVSGDSYQHDLAGRHALKDPQTNVDIGQRYVENLLGADPVNAELMSLLIAYNAGPGSLGKWKQQYADTLNDPLLFIESIPTPETRIYVERVMTNYWIYRLRLGHPPASLDEVAEGRWAFYNKPDPIRRTERARLLYTLLAGN